MKCLTGVIVLNFFLSVNCVNNNEDVWEENLTNKFSIDASTEGLQKVNLKCGSESMTVELLTKEEFNGVMYTRGSFYKQKEPCFVKPKLSGDKTLKMKFNFNQCQTLKEGDVFSNVIIIQHDAELITTGDAAFQVECDFRKPRSLTVGADFQARDTSKTVFGSRITLTSPDPSAVSHHKRSKRDTVKSDTHEVTFIPYLEEDDSESDYEEVIIGSSSNERKIVDEL
ncbi:hypothetical protein PVAND_009100 [Polypedilum vanderplanki]|uniref:ZP domain-containing protein n=1 Tax=Polypedilum vanderplanki TaxID=319348 RepID=A0A9J6CBN3_POLVA|nr:hypothetical protein PVAND_009100 [Polypedilum vanderplanki]